MMFKQEAHRSKSVEPRYIKSFATIRNAKSKTPGILDKEVEPIVHNSKSPRLCLGDLPSHRNPDHYYGKLPAPKPNVKDLLSFNYQRDYLFRLNQRK